MEHKIKINVYCGESIEDSPDIGTETHPVSQVKNALRLINETRSLKKTSSAKSNSPDFVYTIKHICEFKGIAVEFFLNGESQGNDIERIFEDFNRAFDLVNEVIEFKKQADEKY